MCCFVLCSATILGKVSTNWRLCFPFAHCWGKHVYSTGLPLLSWNNTVLVARHRHPLKTTLCHIFRDLSDTQEIWLLQTQLRWLCLTSCCSTVQKPRKKSFTSHTALFEQGCQWLFLSERELFPQKKQENLKDIRYTVFSITSSASVVSWKHSISKSNCVTQHIFSHPLRSMYFTFFIPVCQYQWWKNINNDSYICICIISTVESIPLLPSSPSSPASCYTAHVQPGAHRILASLPANLLFTSISFFF